jgi:hypothetical protein
MIRDEQFWTSIIQDSTDRLAEPWKFGAEVLERLFRYESDKDRGIERFRQAMANGIWWADDAVTCLECILTNQRPPVPLGQWVQHHAGAIWRGDQIADEAMHAQWLREMVARLRAEFENYLLQSEKGHGGGP